MRFLNRHHCRFAHGRQAIRGLLLFLVAASLPRIAIASVLPEEYRVSNNTQLAGVIEAKYILIAKDATVTAMGDLVLRGKRIQIDGNIVAGPSVSTVGDQHKAINLEVSSAGDLVINGSIVGGAPPRESPMRVSQGVNGRGEPLMFVSGVAGGRGGDITLRAGPKSTLHVGPQSVVRGAEGARGGDADATATVGRQGEASENAQSIGGRGGDAGAVTLQAGSFDIRGMVQLGDGGDGGHAIARGGDGSDDSIQDGAWYRAMVGGYAVAMGGSGGLSAELRGVPIPEDLAVATALVSHFRTGRGGSGGNAEAYAGATGKITTDPSVVASVPHALPVVPSGLPIISAEEFAAGECLATAGHGGDGANSGGYGGNGGKALTGKAADGASGIGTLSAGANGSDNNAVGGSGGDGHCSFGFGGDGGNANSATVGPGGNGGDGSPAGCTVTTTPDSSNGGNGGHSTATGGTGGRGACCLLSDGTGGHGGSATASNAAVGGKGGCCSDGGKGGSLTANSGRGGNGDQAGNGGSGFTGSAGVGGAGGDCPCPLSGPGKQGGNGGAGATLTTRGGNGGDGCDSGAGGNGGNATAGSTGHGGDAGSGNPAGVPGSPGSGATTTAGSGGANGGSAGSANVPVTGNAGDPGTDVTCPETFSVLFIDKQSTNLSTGRVIFEIVSGATRKKCIEYNVPPGTLATTTTTKVATLLAFPPTSGITAVQIAPQIVTITTSFPSVSRVCPAAPSDTCAGSAPGPYCGAGSNIGFQVVYGQEYGKDISQQEIQPLQWGSGAKNALNWPAFETATSYRLYRGVPTDLSSLLDANVDSCTRFEGTGTTTGPILTEDPASVAKRFYWYLIVGLNGTIEGPAGNATVGPRTLNSSGTCP